MTTLLALEYELKQTTYRYNKAFESLILKSSVERGFIQGEV